MNQKFGNWLQRVFAGRYGVDQLSLAILVLDLILCLVGMFTRNGWLNLLAYIPMVLVLYRMLSKNTYRRYQENRRFLQLNGGTQRYSFGSQLSYTPIFYSICASHKPLPYNNTNCEKVKRKSEKIFVFYWGRKEVPQN